MTDGLAGEPERAGQCRRAVIWQRVDRPGNEYFELWEYPDGWALSGTVVLADAGAPLLVRYAVSCDSRWITRGTRVLVCANGVERRLVLRAADGRWWLGEEEIPGVRGAIDVDIAYTPSTNTLPIRRLALAVGESREVTAAWVRGSDLGVEPLPQRYTRLTASRYRYESRGGAFVAELETDPDGLVVDYPPAWQRVAVTAH